MRTVILIEHFRFGSFSTVQFPIHDFRFGAIADISIPVFASYPEDGHAF